MAGGLVTYSASVSASPKPTIAQVTAQVKALSSQADRAIQRYDQVKEQLAAANSRLKMVNTEVARDQARFKIARRGVAAAAATAYEDGNLTSMAALITSASPQTVLARAAMLVQLSSTRSAQMRAFIAAARQLSGAQQTAKRTRAAIAALRNQARARVDAARKALSQKKSLLATLTARQQRTVTSAASPGGGGGGAGGGGGSTRRAPRPVPASGSAGKAVAFAYAQLGCPYVYGGTGPCSSGYDCSGLAQAAWAYAGVSIPRDTYEQWAALPHVPLSQLQPGDLIYFNGESHVGMYVGGGYMIDAPEPGRTVEKVRLSGWYASTEDGAARP
jgi:cell wall-associated NlpC family hydrolase